MNATIMPIDHADKVKKLTVPQPPPEIRGDQLYALAVVAVLVSLVLTAAWFALKANAERQLTASIYELTEQAIRTQTPACSIQVVAGIKVQNCITTVAQ
jgi:hypothetical protein